MNVRKNMIIANDRIITPDIQWLAYNSQSGKYDIHFNNGKLYSYNYSSIVWLKNPTALNPALCRITHKGRELFKIAAIYVFEGSSAEYWHVCFENGSERDYNKLYLHVIYSCLSDAVARDTFKYLKQTADLVGLRAEDGTNLLLRHYDKLDFIPNDTALAAYLNPNTYKQNAISKATPIFPFGCNASQYKAVKAALENQISVIQGPPGTGKTQTILNIIANILVAGKTVQVVSNNNSATENVLEKLSSPKYGMGFLVAPLGRAYNKSAFIQNQTGYYPDIASWKNEQAADADMLLNIQRLSNELNMVFTKQERLALAKQELHALEVELKYFMQYTAETNDGNTETKLNKMLIASRLMELWHECHHLADRRQHLSFPFKLKNCFLYGISNWNFFNQDISKIITAVQSLFYTAKKDELTCEINTIKKELDSIHSDALSKDLSTLSMQYLKAKLYSKYGGKEERQVFEIEDLRNNTQAFQLEYPIVLSTTFSSRSCLPPNAAFDYLIMDEASQVDVATGALALSCAKNAVIVGDAKQLPNVVTGDIQKRADALFASFDISDSYSFAHKSFLQSVCELLSQVPQTLLREHYRCHPKIINFCNQKFYSGNLLIMTGDNGESDVLSVIKTVVGDHVRDHMNQRQIDVVHKEILPYMSHFAQEIGVIAPYNNQVDAIKKALPNEKMDIATVHKFQGREKDAIILTTVDNVVSDFTDDPYLLNVAVSRAKKQLCLVVSGNEQPADSNIGDLISYIEYNNFTVTQSKIYTVFDYLYSQYTESRLAYLKKHRRISEYDSENLMYALIKNTLQESKDTSLDVFCHPSLKVIIRDPMLLNDEQCKYAMNSTTHIDFLIFNRISKKPVLAIEVDGFHYHKEGTLQAQRDKMKNHILALYDIPYLRFATNGSGEKETLIGKLNEIAQYGAARKNSI